MAKCVNTTEKGETKENLKLDSITATEKVILKPKVKPTTIATSIPTTKAASKDEKISRKAVHIKSQDEQVPAVSTATIQLSPSTLEQQQELQTKKPSLLPKPKVKVVLPPALLQKQQQQHQQEQQQEEIENYEEGDDTETDATTSSRIPVRTANAEKRALLSGLTPTSTPSGNISASSLLSTSDTKKSKALIK